MSSKRGDGPVQVNDLVGLIERVYVDAEVSKERLQAAVDELQAMVSSNFKDDAMTAYARLVVVIDRAEKHADQLRSSVEPMKEAAGPVFDQWETDLDAFSGQRLRERSRKRLNATRARYETIVAAVDSVQSAYDAFNRNLRDHALFLSHDLNPAAMAEIQDDVTALAGDARKLQDGLDDCLMATRVYVEAAALPAAMAPARPEPIRVAGQKARAARTERARGIRQDG